jgi:hypothetical protein
VCTLSTSFNSLVNTVLPILKEETKIQIRKFSQGTEPVKISAKVQTQQCPCFSYFISTNEALHEALLDKTDESSTFMIEEIEEGQQPFLFYLPLPNSPATHTIQEPLRQCHTILDFLRLSLKNAAASLNIPSEFVDKDYI